MEPFHHPIRFRMVCRGRSAADAPCGHQLIPNGSAELRPPVCRDGGRDAECRDPAVGESIRHCFRCHVRKWYCLRPSRQPVHYCQEVAKAIRWRERHQVHVQVLKSLLRNDEFSDGRHSMPNHLGPLAGKTVTSPSRCIMAHVGPKELVTDGLTSPFDSWMTESMDGVKHSSSPRIRDERPWSACGEVDEEFGCTEIH